MHTEPTKCHALCIDPELDTCMRLKQATTAVPLFSSMRQCSTPQEAMSFLDAEQRPCDIIFIAERLATEDATTFITQAKGNKFSQDAAFVLVMASTEDTGNRIASMMINGFDGFLVEPYSVDSLIEMTRLAAKVKKERGETRAKTAANMVVTEMMEQLDIVAFLKTCGYGLGKSWLKFKELGGQLASLGTQYWDVCTSAVLTLIAEAPLRKQNLLTKKYLGASARVRKKMEEKLIAEAEKTKATERPAQRNAAPSPQVLRKNS